MKKTLLILLPILLFTFCKKLDKAKPVMFHDNYIPSEVGQWNEYEVTEITHTSTGAHDTISYYLKEVVAEEISSNKFRLERFWKDSITGNWAIKDVWTREKATTFFQQIEENVSYTKLVFPIKKDQYWNGNAFNSQEELTYEYDLIHTAYSLNSLNFDSTVTVIQQDNVNAIEYQKASEVYAKNIGLIFKTKRDLSINLFDVTDINEGTELEMKLIDYGN